LRIDRHVNIGDAEPVATPTLLVILVLVAALAILPAVGARRWRAGIDNLRSELDSARRTVAPARVDFAELVGLPAPVQRWFQQTLTDGQPMIEAVSLRHSGHFNASEDPERWRPFRSEQRVVLRRPGFLWDARIALIPGVAVRVRDAYIGGNGLLMASIAGLVAVVDVEDGGALADAELMRFIAEAAWYPTALLPSQGVRWTPLDDRSASATLGDGDRRATLDFHFDHQGLLARVYAESRWRLVNADPVATPWQGRFWNYQSRGGMRIPMDGEVAWLLPDGPRPYWRGHIDAIDYDFAT
jgi:hypothetical protein